MRALNHEEVEALKDRICQFVDLSAELPRIDLVPSPVAEVVNCRVEVRFLYARQALIEHFKGVAIGNSIYFCLPLMKC